MLPDNELSSNPVPAVFIGGGALPVRDTVDYELGGIALNDPSEGLQYQIWRARIESEDTEIIIDAQNVDPFVLITGVDITEVSISFDQNMNPVVAYVEDGTAKLYWYDSTVHGMVTTSFPTIVTPRVSMDDKRKSQSQNNDVIFAYMKNSNLYMRMQRDRYSVEYLLAENVDSPGLIKIGMSRQNRFQFMFRNPE